MITAVFFMLAQAGGPAAHGIDVFAAANILKFADHVFEDKDYATALGEYRRYAFLGDSQPGYVTDRIIVCLTELNRFDEALVEAGRLEERSRREYAKGMVFYRAGNYDSSRSHLKLTEVGTDYAGPARKLIGMGYAEEFAFKKAAEYIDLPGPLPRYRNPLLGGFLSIVPGCGHFYSGRVSDGIYALVIVSAASVLSWYYYDRDEKVKFGLCLGAGALFYLGNIYGGVNAARNYNFYQDLTFLEKIKESAR